LPAAALAAPQEAGDPGDPAADHEARDRGADEDLALVLDDVRAPVGDAVDLAAQAADRLAQLDPVLLDVAPDLLRGALARSRHQRLTVSLIALASSIAMSGVGGAPRLIHRIPTAAAMP